MAAPPPPTVTLVITEESTTTLMLGGVMLAVGITFIIATCAAAVICAQRRAAKVLDATLGSSESGWLRRQGETAVLPAAPPTAAAVYTAMTEAPSGLCVTLLSLQLTDASSLSEGGGVVVEIDVPGDGAIFRMDTAAKVSAAGHASLGGFSRSFAVGPAEPLGVAFDAALDSPEPEDSEVQLVLLAVDGSGAALPDELGTARVSLETLVAGGTDFRGPLKVVGPDGAERGTLTCAVGGIGSLLPMSVAKGKVSVATLRNYRSRLKLAPLAAAAATTVAATRLRGLRAKRGAAPRLASPAAAAAPARAAAVTEVLCAAATAAAGATATAAAKVATADEAVAGALAAAVASN